MPIGEICTRDVVIVKPKDSIIEAAKLMRSYHVGDVIVVDEQDGQAIPIGILTDRDIVIELIAQEVSVENMLVEDVMTDDLMVVKESSGRWDAVQSMRIKGVRRIVVVNDHGALVGIVSSDDLLELISQELLDLVKAVMRQQDREKESRG